MALVYAIVIIVSFSMLFPYYYMVIITFSTNEEVFSPSLNLLPINWRLDTYINIWQIIPFFKGVLNTLTVAIPVITVGTFVSALAAYSFAKMKLKLKRVLLLTLMSSMMIPYASILLPQYQIYNSLDMTRDCLLPLILPGLFGNIGMIFFFIQFMTSIPNSLFEASKIDGSGHFQSFLFIMFPLLWPAVAAQAVFWFLGIWNDFFGPSIYLTTQSAMTLQVLVESLSPSDGRLGDFPMMMTGAVLSSIPLIMIYLIFQKFFMRSLAITSGVKL